MKYLMRLHQFNRKIGLKEILLSLIIVFLFILWIIFLNLIKFKCPFHEYLNIWCAGCGGTRMLISIIHLDFYQAFRWNPFLFILLLIGIVYLIVGVIIYKRKKLLLLPTYRMIIIIISLLVLFMIIRNLDMFSYLVPTKI